MTRFFDITKTGAGMKETKVLFRGASWVTPLSIAFVALLPSGALAQADPYGRSSYGTPQRPADISNMQVYQTGMGAAPIQQNQRAPEQVITVPEPEPEERAAAQIQRRSTNPVLSRYPQVMQQQAQQPSQPAVAQQQPAPVATAPQMTPQEAQQAALNKALGIEQSNVRFGVALFPSAPPPADACMAVAGPVGDTSAFVNVVDGSKFKKVSQLEKLRKKQKTGTIFVRGGNFEGEEIEKPKLNNMCFLDANFKHTKWEKVDVEGLGFINSDLTGANIEGAKMRYSLFRDVILADVNGTGADLSYSRLDGGWEGSMRNLMLNQANLTGFRVECGFTSENGCPFDRQGLQLRGANMTKASFYAFDFPDVDIQDAVMDQTEIGLQHVARLSGAKLMGPLVVRSHNNAAIYLPTEYARLRQALLMGVQGIASFDCAGQQTTVKKAICTSSGSELRRLDREVSQLETDVEQRYRNHARNREGWNRAVADKCGTLQADDIAECLKVEYRQRREELIGKAGAPDWMKPNSYALFIASEAPISKEFLASELFLRVRPVVLDSAPSKVMVEIDRKGRMTAKGGAMGTCRLQASDLSFDSSTGWVSAGGTPRTRRRAAVPGTPVFRAVGDEMRVYGDATIIGESSETAPNPYVRCGPNSSFTMMQLVPLAQEELAQIWTRFR